MLERQPRFGTSPCRGIEDTPSSQLPAPWPESELNAVALQRTWVRKPAGCVGLQPMSLSAMSRRGRCPTIISTSTLSHPRCCS